MTFASSFGSTGHLARRFLRSLSACRPGVADQEWVATLLPPPLASVFWSQPVPDQVHALRVARCVATTAPSRPDLARAALLHDAGKRHARLGTIGRSLATVCSVLRLPRTARMEAYLAHAGSGATELGALGCEPVVVAFAAAHHRERPATVPEADWVVLVGCDDE